jgi:ribosomal-protein-alanine N-acetyltransferase
MASLELLRPDHAAALLKFETENRAYFAKSIPDRGDYYFEHFADRHAELLAEQAIGTCMFHVLVDMPIDMPVDRGQILGRVNLVDIANKEAELGFRIAEHAAGKGLATAAVHEMFALAIDEYGLTRLRASARLDNLGSQAVLTRTGFVRTGETVLSGQRGITYLRDLTQ